MKRRAAEELAAAIIRHVPELAGKVFPYHREPTNSSEFPNVVVLPGSYTVQFWEESEEEPSTSDLVVSVGEWDGTCEIRATAPTPFEREELEDLIVDCFVQDPDRPGIILVAMENVEVGGIDTSFTARGAFIMTHEDWREEFAFAEKRSSYLTLDAEIPLLALRTNTPTIEKLDHFSSLTGVKSKDRTEILSSAGTLDITFEEMTAENLRLALERKSNFLINARTWGLIKKPFLTNCSANRISS